MSTSMPSAADLGIVANSGTDQSALIITALANASYSGIVFDFPPASKIYISNSINAAGKVLKFIPGTYLTGPATSTAIISNFVLDCGYRQQCFDPACGLVFNPAGTTLGKISPWVFGATPGSTDSAPAIQATINLIIRNTGVQTLFIPAGGYTCNSPLICYNWNVTDYANFQISIEGESNFWEASGYGTQLNFSGIPPSNSTFGIGFQLTKGSSIKNIKLTGKWNYNYTTAAAFYNTSISNFTDSNGCLDQPNAPYAGIVIDPFCPTAPVDSKGDYAGYYGLNSYYRGVSTSGSTGVTLEDVFISNFTVGFVTSPNGVTSNAELIRAEKIQFANMKICIVGCQAQEKVNVFRHIGCWGICHTIFYSGSGGGSGYGANSPGNWYVEDVNLAGANNQLIYSNQTSYFPSYFKNIYAESLGRLGTIHTFLGATFEDSNIDFANYEAAGSYQSQIVATGVTFIGCNFRMYGTNMPVTINSGNGGCCFDSCSFEVVPFYNIGAPTGDPQFINCSIQQSNVWLGLGPVSMPFIPQFTGTFAYGGGRINGNGENYTLGSRSPALPINVNRSGAGYVITTSLVGSYYQTTVTCTSDELNRVFVNDVIVASTDGTLRGLQVMGIVTAVGTGNFTINYIPPTVTSGTRYYLFVWLPLYNISFTGNTVSGSNQITNVALLAGSLPTFVSCGGLLETTSVTVTDQWASNLVRLTGYNATTSTITFDANAKATAVKNLFTNTNAVPDPMTPTIAAGAGAGSTPVVAITKGNDQNMQISINTGTTPSASAVIGTVSFGIPFAGGYVPSPRFSPANAAAAALSGPGQVFADAGASSGFTIMSGSSALAASTLYLWNVEVG